MSKSYKKTPISKIKGNDKDNYWKRVRSSTNNLLRSKDINQLKELSLPDPKSIVNDYDYTDQWWMCGDIEKCKCEKHYGFKKCLRK